MRLIQRWVYGQPAERESAKQDWGKIIGAATLEIQHAIVSGKPMITILLS